MHLEIQFAQEEDHRWIAEIEALPGVMSYGLTQAEAERKVIALAFQVLAEQLEAGEMAAVQNISFVKAA